jgi:hypothetical protein
MWEDTEADFPMGIKRDELPTNFPFHPKVLTEPLADFSSQNKNRGKKGATDRPDWKSPAESNFSSFEAKKGPRSGTAGNKPLPNREICNFHDPSAKHSPMECRAPLDKKRLMIHKQRLCYNCLGKGHTSAKCHFTVGCTDCNQAHHPSLCTKNQKYLTPNNNNKKPWNGGKNGGKNGGQKENYQKGKHQEKKDDKRVHFAKSEKSDAERMNEQDREWNQANGMVVTSEGRHGANTSGKQGER